MLGPVMVDIQGKTLCPEDHELLAHPMVGGIILFSRNYQDQEQLSHLVTSIRARYPDLLLAVDQEGGRVQRFIEGFTRLPALATLGKLYQDNPVGTCIQAKKLGWLMASELRAFDIDISFAPVLDLDLGISQVIGDRAFTDKPRTLIALALAYMDGMHRAGMAATGKHFPGHGSVSLDSHHALPVDEREFKEISELDLVPFKALAAQGLDAIMPAHVLYPKVDDKPACFSPLWLKKILRQTLNFNGAIFSDDLSMIGAHSQGLPCERAEQALNAGCDMILLLNDRNSAQHVLDHLSAHKMTLCREQQQRLSNMKARPSIDWPTLLQHPDYRHAQDLAVQLCNDALK